MAKASPDGLDLKTIRSLLTAAERRVFDSSVGKVVAAAGREQLQSAIGQARTLRDKWRELYARQTRTTKRTAKTGSASNDRSREKAELFAGVIERLEKRLAELGTAVKKTVQKATRTARPHAANVKAARPTPKKVRTAAHRKTRAGVKNELKHAAHGAGAKKPATKRSGGTAGR